MHLNQDIPYPTSHRIMSHHRGCMGSMRHTGGAHGYRSCNCLASWSLLWTAKLSWSAADVPGASFVTSAHQTCLRWRIPWCVGHSDGDEPFMHIKHLADPKDNECDAVRISGLNAQIVMEPQFVFQSEGGSGGGR